jgi:hypothetical protein
VCKDPTSSSVKYEYSPSLVHHRREQRSFGPSQNYINLSGTENLTAIMVNINLKSIGGLSERGPQQDLYRFLGTHLRDITTRFLPQNGAAK